MTTTVAKDRSPGQGRDTADVLGCRIDRIGMDDTVRRAVETIEARGYVQHVSINAAKLVAVHDDQALREIVSACDMVSADGQAIVWASRLLGDPLPERVAGVDLMFRLFEVAAQRGYRVYILGAESNVLEQAVTKLRDEYPGLRFAGWRHGYFKPSEHDAVARDIRESKADILFVAISSPAKEQFLGAYGSDLGVPFVMGVGGAIDIVAGVTRRAPIWCQRLGLEWLYRMAQEPRRMMKRYSVTNARFLSLLLLSMAAQASERLRR